MFLAERNIYLGRSLLDVLEHVLRGMRLRIPARQQSVHHRDISRSRAAASEMLVDRSPVPDPTMAGRRRVEERRQVALRDMLAAMLCTARSQAEEKAMRRQMRRTRKHK